MWEINVAISKCFFCQIRFVQCLSINRHISVHININPLSRTCDHALDQELIPLPKCNDFSCLQLIGLHWYYNLPGFQCRWHGRTVELQNRHRVATRTEIAATTSSTAIVPRSVLWYTARCLSLFCSFSTSSIVGILTECSFFFTTLISHILLGLLCQACQFFFLCFYRFKISISSFLCRLEYAT